MHKEDRNMIISQLISYLKQNVSIHAIWASHEPNNQENKYCELGYYPINYHASQSTNHCYGLTEPECYGASECHYEDGQCYKYEQATCVQIPQPGTKLSQNDISSYVK